MVKKSLFVISLRHDLKSSFVLKIESKLPKWTKIISVIIICSLCISWIDRTSRNRYGFPTSNDSKSVQAN